MERFAKQVGLAAICAVVAVSASAQVLVPVTSTAPRARPQFEAVPAPAPVRYEAPIPKTTSQIQPQPSLEQPQANPPEDVSLEDGGRIDVMCFGAGAANKVAVVQSYGTASVSGLAGGDVVSLSGSGQSTTFGTRSQEFSDQVSLYLQADEGRVRMPRTMLPAIRGGEDGWFKLKDIKIKANEITASIAVNILNNPKLRLDRYSGAISISGKAGDFAGNCQRLVREQTQRKF